MDPFTALTIASVGMSVYSSIAGAKEKARAYRLQAEQNRIKAAEIARRKEVNADILREQALEVQGTQAVVSSAAGGGAGGGATLMSMYKNFRSLSEQLIENDREAEFAQRAALLSASETDRLATQSIKAGQFSAASDLLGGFRALSDKEPSKE